VATIIGKKKLAASAKRKPTRRKPRFIVNEQGEPVEVLLSIGEYERIMEELADIEDTRIVAERLKAPTWIPWEKAKKRLHVSDKY
jgi:PHD/YefM family antitoxin component YafN of YafNO toxin-antitoxin module